MDMESSFKEDTPLFHNVKGVGRCSSVDESGLLLNYDKKGLGNSDTKYGALQESFSCEENSYSDSHKLLTTDSCRLKFMPEKDDQKEFYVNSNREDILVTIKHHYHRVKSFLNTDRNKCILKNIKIGLLFLATIISSIIFATEDDLSFATHQFSVSRRTSKTINVTGATPKFPVAYLRISGSFLLQYPSKSTQNITIQLRNPVTGTVKESKSAYANNSALAPVLPERTLTHSFDFSGEHFSDHLEMRIMSDTFNSVPVDVLYTFISTNIFDGVIYGAIILALMYILIIFDLIHRTLAAMIGALGSIAVLAALNLKPSIEVVLTWLDYDTLCLLFGMMVLVAVFCETGFFDWLALQCYKLAKGKTWPLITLLCLICAVMSAFLDNVTTILLLTPITIRLCEVMDLDPKHILIAEVLFSNIGGTATAIGDPPNVLIISDSSIERQSDGKITFASFTLHMAVGTFFTAISAYGLLRLMYRKKELLMTTDPHEIAQIKVEVSIWRRSANKIAVASREDNIVKDLLNQKAESLERELLVKEKELIGASRMSVFDETLVELEGKYIIRDYVLLIKSLCCLVAVVICFFLNSFVDSMHLSIGWTAMLGAIWLLVLSDYTDLDSILHRIEWATLLFFAALFVLMEALSQLRLIQWLADNAKNLIEQVDEDARMAVAIIIIIWMSAIASSFIDNIPFTTAMIPVILELASDPSLRLSLSPLVWSLAFGACLGGNGTLIGASCNVVCAGLAENHGHQFTFGEFFKVGFPTMLVTVFIAMCYLLICHVALDWHL